MERQDWDPQNHMVLGQLGLLPSENTYARGKRKREDGNFEEEGSALKKMRCMEESLVPDNHLLPEGWDEEFLERLRPVTRPTNHKRTRATDNLYLISLPQLPHSTTTAGSIGFPVHLEQRVNNEELSLEACARQRRDRYLDEAAHLPVEHDNSEMSRRSPRNRKAAHSLTKEDVVDLSSDTEQPLRQKEESKDSTAPFETDSIVLYSTRVKPNSGKKLREHSDTADLQHPTKSVSSGNAGTLRSGCPIHIREEKNASLGGNERDQKASNESKVPPKKWDFFSTLNKRKPSNIPDYGNPRAAAPVPVPSSSPEQESMARVTGGPKPWNNLSGNKATPNPNTPYKKPEIRNGHSASDQITHFNSHSKIGQASKPPQEKAFDLVAGHNRLDGQPPSKRQRVEGTPTSRNGSSKTSIDIEDESASSSRQMGPPASRSGHSQAAKGPQHKGVEEYHRVEQTVGFRRRKSSSGSQIPNGHGGESRYLRTASGSEIVRLEDPNDPVVDLEDEVAVTQVRYVKKNPSQSARKSTLEVQIPTPSQTEGTTSYRGSAHRQPSRPRNNMWGNGDARQSSEEDKWSKYFPSTENPQQRKISSRSYSADSTTLNRTSARLSGAQNGNSSTKQVPSRDSSPLLDPDVSVDELNADIYHVETADAPLAKQKTASTAAGKSKGASNRSQSIALDDSSDDDLANDKANIPPTTFVSTKTAKGEAASKDEQYNAQLVFSDTDTWLVESSQSPWSLVHNPSFKTLKLFDRGGGSVWTVPTGKVERIEYNSRSKILVISKARDLTTGSSTTHLYFKLCDSHQSNDLGESLKASQPTIQLRGREMAYLNNVVDNKLAKVLSYQEARLAAKKKRHLEEEPEDIQLARVNSQRRLDSKRPSLQETTTSRARIDATRSRGDGMNDPLRPKGLGRSMRTRSSSGQFKDEDLPQPFEVREEVHSREFYGNSASRQANLGISHETRSTRGQYRDQKPRQLRPRSPSPPPLRSWTRDHPNWTREWHNSIIYPAVGKDRARVDMGDIEKLDDGEYLNDNLIVFYLRWLQDQLERQHPELAKRIYFQNTFFYQKLSKPEKGMKSINYEAVKKWTSKVDLLSKDYIIIPINEHSHWYVAIICNAPKLLPGAETTDHLQSQDTDGAPGDEQTNTEDAPKASLASVAPSKQIPESSNGADVDIVMEDMSLEDRRLEGTKELHSVSSGVVEGQEVANSDNPPPANVSSDLLEVGTAKESQAKKSKRKSIPPQRKYNPKEFRIITLDSLGSSHTSTCSNLKDYLVLEIKDKKNIEIQRPGSIGTTAKGIPTQNNYYDCGLFLLSYVEMFLRSPDEFIGGILQNDLDKEYQWPKAPEMRVRIRDLLFHLQKDQLAEAERLAKVKGKGKKASKTEDKSGSASTSKLSSREESKSARASPDGRASDESGGVQEKIIRPKTGPSTKEEPPKSQASASAEPPRSPGLGASNRLSRPVSPLKSDLAKPDKHTSREVHYVDAVSQEISKVPGGMLNGLMTRATKYLPGLFKHEKSAMPNAANSEPSKTDVIDIEESPQKVDSGNSRPRSRDSEVADSSKTLVNVLENGPSSLERVEQPPNSKTRRQHNAQSSQQSLSRHNDRDLASPTPDALESSYRIPTRHEVTDLRSPSPDAVEPVSHESAEAHRRRSPVPQKAQRVSEGRERAVKAPSPEVTQNPSPMVRDSRSAQYPVNELGHSTEAIYDGFKAFGDAEVRDSEDEDPEDDPIDFIKTNPRANSVSKTSREALADDAEMLMQPSNSQEETAEDANSSLLSAPIVPSSPALTSSKRRREGSQSTPSSPALRYEGTRRNVATSPSRGMKRKSPGSGESDNWQELPRSSPTLRDAADRAIIGKYGQRNHQKATHIRFES